VRRKLTAVLLGLAAAFGGWGAGTAVSHASSTPACSPTELAGVDSVPGTGAATPQDELVAFAQDAESYKFGGPFPRASDVARWISNPAASRVEMSDGGDTASIIKDGKLFMRVFLNGDGGSWSVSAWELCA
jgi:hypothetical protein